MDTIESRYVVVELRKLAQGVVKRPWCGICNNIQLGSGVDLLHSAFNSMGVDDNYPVGGREEYQQDEWDGRGKWGGVRGLNRRMFAFAVAYHIEHVM